MTIEDVYERKHFAETLRSLRKYVGLSPRELARRSGMSRKTISQLERGQAAPTEAVRAQLEKALGCPLCFGPHKQVPVQVGRLQAEVDEGIAPLIEAIWRAGIETVMSCQQNTRGCVWLCFPHACEAEKFLNLVARYEDGEDELYWRINPEWDNRGPLPRWEYSVNIEDLALVNVGDEDVIEYAYDPPPAFLFSVSVRFPPQDLPVVLQRLREHSALAAGQNGRPARQNGQAAGEGRGPAKEAQGTLRAAGTSGMGPEQDGVEGGLAG
jgi:transcriptional regulator with XRE-family HTH domain